MTDRAGPLGLPAPRALVFDLDGTLVDTVGTRVEAWMETFPAFGIQPERGFLAPLMGSDGRLLARTVAAHAGVELAAGDDIEIDRMAGERFGELNAHPGPLPSVGDALAYLDEAGLPWAIATSSRPDEARASVEALGRARRPVVVDGSDVERAKPAPDLLLKAAARLGIEPAETWYVGDARWDMMAAVAAAMVPIGISTGATSEADLAATGAHATFPTLEGLLAALIRVRDGA
jgi:HAD superfamily hydrolase (TIGR01509 family)